MKRFVLWLIKVFRLDIPVEVVKTVEKVVYMPKNGVIDGDVLIKGDVFVTGTMSIEGSVTIYVGKEDM